MSKPSPFGKPKYCPYAKSDMTPCVYRDGDYCYAIDSRGTPICVGCERTKEQIFNSKMEKSDASE